MADLGSASLPTIIRKRLSGGVDEGQSALLKRAVIAVTITALLWSWGSAIHRVPANGPVLYDAWQNLTLAYNLSHHGVVSVSSDSARLRPSNKREPLPTAFLALHMASIEAVYGAMTLQQYQNGVGTGRLKASNVFWAALLAFAVFASIVQLSGSFLLAGLGTWFANLTVLKYLNNLLTEPQAAAILTLACYVGVVALAKRHVLYFGLAGVCFGALALTKAAGFYVAIVLACLLLGSGLWQLQWPTEARSVRLPSVIVFALGFAFTAGPWMLRNYVLLDSTGIVDNRAAIVLMVRGAKNNMSWAEYRGSFFAWAPNELLRRAASALLGFSDTDLNRGGRLQRLNYRTWKGDILASEREAVRAGRPQDAVSFRYRAGAEHMKIRRELIGQGYSGIAAESELQRRAIRQILSDPIKHVAMTVAFLWRGAGVMFPVLGIVVCLAVRVRRPDLIVYVLPALGLVLFYALVTHFLPRYGDPMVPVTIVGGLVLSHAVVRQWINRLAGCMDLTERQGTCRRA